jgi:hypothetical protein
MAAMKMWPAPKPGERYIYTATFTEGPVMRFLRWIGVVRDPLRQVTKCFQIDDAGKPFEIPIPKDDPTLVEFYRKRSEDFRIDRDRCAMEAEYQRNAFNSAIDRARNAETETNAMLERALRAEKELEVRKATDHLSSLDKLDSAPKTEDAIDQAAKARAAYIKDKGAIPTKLRCGHEFMSRAVAQSAKWGLVGIDPKYINKNKGNAVGMDWEVDESLPPNEFILSHESDTLKAE